MKSVRIMILGVGLLLLAVFCELMSMNRIVGEFWSYYFPIGAVIAGMICLILGLCREDDARTDR